MEASFFFGVGWFGLLALVVLVGFFCFGLPSLCCFFSFVCFVFLWCSLVLVLLSLFVLLCLFSLGWAGFLIAFFCLSWWLPSALACPFCLVSASSALSLCPAFSLPVFLFLCCCCCCCFLCALAWFL